MVFLDSAGKYSRIGDAERVRKWVNERITVAAPLPVRATPALPSIVPALPAAPVVAPAAAAPVALNAAPMPVAKSGNTTASTP